MLKSPTQETITTLYECYKSKEYPHFFRHLLPDLQLEQFISAMLLMGLVYNIVDNNQIIGFLTSNINTITRNASLGILILKEHQSKKYALSTLAKYIDLLFHRKVHKIIFSISSADERSLKIIEESDFIKEATLRDTSRYNGNYHNDIVYVLPHKRYKRLIKLRNKMKEG